jgi:hypothetical protein
MSKATDSSTKAIRERMAKQKEEFLNTFATSLALVASTCRKVGITRQTFYNWYNEDQEFADKIDEIKELAKDSVEQRIYTKIKNGDTAMIIFYAKTKMKDRGYVERHEVTGKDGEPLNDNRKTVDVSKLTEEQRNALLEIGEDVLNKMDEE